VLFLAGYERLGIGCDWLQRKLDVRGVQAAPGAVDDLEDFEGVASVNDR
jgi:hypothetical protein